MTIDPRSILVAGILAMGVACTREATLQGEALFGRYCASCHGPVGAGDGPAAESMSPRPTDLRRLSAGVPDLMQAVDGRRVIRAHGSGAMPVWGTVFEGARDGEPHAGRATLHEVQALAEYVRGLQQRP